MAKPYTFPIIIDSLKTLRIGFLSKHGYFKLNQIQSGIVSWHRGGKQISSIAVTVNTSVEKPFIQLNYNCCDEVIDYTVQLISVPSNLGKGLTWYFICPYTNKRCRKLHLADKYFYHRTAIKNVIYEKQTQSKFYRELDKTLGEYYRSDQYYAELKQKHFKKNYAGKPTKRYLKLLAKLKKTEGITAHEIYELEKSMYK